MTFDRARRSMVAVMTAGLLGAWGCGAPGPERGVPLAGVEAGLPDGAGASVVADAAADGPADAAVAPDSGPDAGTWTFPRLANLGGKTVPLPRIVPIFFQGDPAASTIPPFLAALVASDAWATFTREYGARATTVTSPIVLPEAAPASVTWDAIEALVAGLAAKQADPDYGNAIYSIFYPVETKIDFVSLRSCAEFLGYHLRVRDANRAIYAVMATCPTGTLPGVSTRDQITSTLTHELMEAITNPGFFAEPAYGAMDEDHLAWTLGSGSVSGVTEVGDLCQNDPASVYLPPGLPAAIQRYWSNASAAMGHDPCLPALPGKPYFNAALAMNEPIVIGDRKTRGLRVALGETRTIDVHLFSDGKAAQWRVTPLTTGMPPSLSFAWKGPDHGVAGDVLHLAVTVVRASAAGHLVVLRSQAPSNPQRRTYWYGLVQD